MLKRSVAFGLNVTKLLIALVLVANVQIARAEHAGGAAAAVIAQAVLGAQPSQEAIKCLNRIMDRCYMSKNDQERFLASVEKCKHVNSGSGKTEIEVILQKGSDKVLVMETKGQDYDKAGSVAKSQQIASDAKTGKNCPTTKYTVDRSGINDFKVLGNRFWMVSNDGQVYFATADESFNEVLNSSGKSYSDVKQIKGVSGEPNSAELVFKAGHSTVITQEKLQAKIKNGQVRKIEFVKVPTERSIFRDE